MQTNTTRRELVAGTFGLAGSSRGANQGFAPRIVCNTYLWVQVFQTPIAYINPNPPPRDPNRPAPARRARRDWTEENWQTCFEEMQSAGFKRAELMSWVVEQKPVDELKALLRKYDLVFNHVYHGATMHPASAADTAIVKALELADLIRPMTQVMVFDPFGGNGQLSSEEERYRVDSLNKLGRQLKERGTSMLLHNHNTPMRENARQWRYVLENTDPKAVSFCLDLDWTWQAGTDPFPVLYEAGDKGRLGAIHMRTQHNRIWDQTMEDGGDINFHKVAEYLKKIQFNGIVVEETELMEQTKVTRSTVENKKLGRIWCENAFGVSALA